MRHISSLSFLILAFTTYEVCVMQVASFECGTVTFTRGLIWNGEKTVKGEWPFLTALFKVQEEGKNEFFCGGSLISSKHVLTAAHCIQDKSSSNKRLPGEISLLLGAYDLTSKSEIGVQQRNVKAIHVHTEWNIYSDKYDADLAVLLLSEIVIFTDYIRPVCLPADDTVIDGVRGSVVGWGLTEMGSKPNTEFIKRTFVTGQNGYYCLLEDPGAAVISSPRTFCGRGEDGNANRGDSGGGFYVKNQESVWVQHGIVSAMRTNKTGYVDADSVVLYTNVAKFKKWIVDTVMQSGAEVGEAKTNVKLNLECLFTYGTSGRYACFIHNLNIRSDNIAVASFSGSHLRGKSDNDVEFVQFRNRTMYFIPSGVGQIFKNVKSMQVSENLSTKRIRRPDFQSLENLVSFESFKNDIRTLDYDSLRDLQELEVFKIQNNRLTEIEGGTFQANTKLKVVSLQGNKLEVLPRQLFRNNSLLVNVNLENNLLGIIDESIFETNSKLKEVLLDGNKLEFLPSGLLRNNLLLETIDLGENALKLIDESTFETNSKLQKVYINRNKLEVLPSGLFRNNSLLDSVNLEDNLLRIIDESIFKTNSKLQKVSLQRNKLAVLPIDLFRNNLLLEIINLGENSLKLIDESTFETNIKLRQVAINGNKLEVLPRHLFRNNLLLETIDLGKNSLKIIDESTFERNRKLEKVSLLSNKLAVLPSGLFQNNLLLEVVYLQNNSLNVIDESTFEANSKLKQVSLGVNKLEILPRQLFRNNLLLETIDLGKNSLTQIDESTFETNIKLKEVGINGNKLEFLPRRLFENNLLLKIVSLDNNSLRIIEMDFTSLKNIQKIYFYGNTCIDAYYTGLNIPEIYRNEFRNLTEFNSLIRANCSSPSS